MIFLILAKEFANIIVRTFMLTRFTILFSLFFYPLLIITLAGCSNFDKLHDDLAEIKQSAITIKVTVNSAKDNHSPVIIVAFEDKLGANVLGGKLMPKPETLTYKIVKQEQYLFAFQDVNKNLGFDENEPYAWFSQGRPLVLTESEDIYELTVELLSRNENHLEPPKAFKKLDSIEKLSFSELDLNFGKVSLIDDPLLSTNHALKGLWQPLDFIKDGGVGIHFLSEYDPNKIPILFVHGINGAPDNFKSLISKLDADKYQAWVYSYPSGLSLNMVATGLYSFLATLNHQNSFEQLHIVAHSMGGLVSRGYINLCIENNSCQYLRSFTSISTPWAGHDAAALGVKYAPEVVPVWYDMSPGSDYISGLFVSQFPQNIKHTLFFSVKSTSMLSIENTDDVVSVASQLRYEAQNQATLIYGFDEGHMSILNNNSLSEKLAKILDKQSK